MRRSTLLELPTELCAWVLRASPTSLRAAEGCSRAAGVRPMPESHELTPRAACLMAEAPAASSSAISAPSMEEGWSVVSSASASAASAAPGATEDDDDEEEAAAAEL